MGMYKRKKPYIYLSMIFRGTLYLLTCAHAPKHRIKEILMVLAFLYFFRKVMMKLRRILRFMLGKQLDGLLS